MLYKPELEPAAPIVNGLDINHQYLGVAANVRIRNALYDRYAADGTHIHSEVLSLIGTEPEEVVLDVGCADGQLIVNASKTAHPSAKLIGMDLDDKLFSLYSNTSSSISSQIDFIQGSVNAIGLADNSVDTATALFMLYHSSDPAQALDELHRVLRPDGRLIVATSGSANKRRHRQFEAAIAESLSNDLGQEVQPPPIFAQTFNAERAAELLPNNFEIIETHAQETELVIADDEAVEIYIMSLTTMKGSFSEEPRTVLWRKAIDEVVRPVIEQEITEHGSFRDIVARYYFVCRPKN